MNALRLALVTVLVAGACNGEQRITGSVDAAVEYNYDFSCAGNTAPTTAIPELWVRGIIEEVYTKDGSGTTGPLAGVMLQGCNADAPDCEGANSYGTTMSGPDGSFDFGPTITNNMPLRPVLKATLTGWRTTHGFHSVPVNVDITGVKFRVFRNAFVAQLAALGIAQTADKGMVGVQILDCNDTPIADTANIEYKLLQNGTEVRDTTNVNAGQVMPKFTGSFFIVNVPVGTTMITATYKGMPMLDHPVEVVAGTTAITQMRPGYFTGSVHALPPDV